MGKRLFEEGMMASRQGIHKFIKRFEATGSISRKQGSGRLSKVTEVVKATVDVQMKADNIGTAAPSSTPVERTLPIYKNYPSMSTSAWLDILR